MENREKMLWGKSESKALLFARLFEPNKSGKSLILIINLVLAVFAFSFLVGLMNVEVVSGLTAADFYATDVVGGKGYSIPPPTGGATLVPAAGAQYIESTVGKASGAIQNHLSELGIYSPAQVETGVEAARTTFREAISSQSSYGTSLDISVDAAIDAIEGGPISLAEPGLVPGQTTPGGPISLDLTEEQLVRLRGGESYVEVTGTETAAGAGDAAGAETGGTFWESATWQGLQWAAYAYMAGQMIGPMLGFETEQTQALSLALAAGFGFGKFFATQTTWAGGAQYAGWIGVAIGGGVFLATYKEEDTKTVTFTCLPWQALVGGNDCEECNDPDLPCSEYRCRSLGQSCELVNQGTDEERCVYINPHDVDFPIISPNEALLSPEYEYTDVKTSPPGPGFKIVRKAGIGGGGDEECVKAFTPLIFGIDTNEPAQCKIDFKHTEKFEDMTYWFGGTNLFDYNHTEHFSLPGPEAFANSSLILENGKDFTFFIRCRDKNGNENSAEYAVRFCVDPSPDTTPPQIKETSIENNGCVAAGTNNLNVEFYVNEPADCRWSKENKYYELMENPMDCSNLVYEINALMLYTCRANLTGVSRDETTFYVRCKDQPMKLEDDPDRNKNKESYVFKLRGSGALKMKNLEPTETIYGAVDPSPVTLSVQTLFGCENGKAVCFYSTTGEDADYVTFYDTDTDDGIHTQRQDLGDGEHTYYYKCVDSGGNIAINSTTFNLNIDVDAPVVARIYEEDGMLKIVTVRDSECSYSLDNCDFLFEEGTVMPYANSTVHVAEWKKDRTYYIKCRDEFRNEEAGCSVIAKPTDLLL